MSSSNDPLDHFDKRSDSWNELYSRPQFRDRLNLFATKLKGYVTSGSVLDYGCGGGIIACQVAGDSGYTVKGVDGAEGMIKQSIQLAQARKLENVSFEHIDPPNWACETKFDAIVCSSVIEYVEQDEKLLKVLSDGLEDQGYLLISIPTTPSLLGFVEDLLLPTIRKRSDTTFATKRYKLVDFEQMLQRSGLELCETVSFEFPVLGQVGVRCSRIPWLGLMTLVVARKVS